MSFDPATSDLVCSLFLTATGLAVSLFGGFRAPPAAATRWRVSFLLAAVGSVILDFDGSTALAGRILSGALPLAVLPAQLDGLIEFLALGRRPLLHRINLAVAGAWIATYVAVSLGPDHTLARCELFCAGVALAAGVALVAIVRSGESWVMAGLRGLGICYGIFAVMFGTMAVLAGTVPIAVLAMNPILPALALFASAPLIVFQAFAFLSADRHRSEHELLSANASLAYGAASDPLTKLPNRRSFLESGGSLVALAHRHGRPLSLLLLEIDNFRQIADQHGRSASDRLVIVISEAIGRMVRTSDVLGRLGPETFGLLLVETSQRSAELTAERLRRGVAAIRTLPEGVERATISLGLAALTEQDTDLESLVQKADEALDRSRREGRNRWTAVA